MVGALGKPNSIYNCSIVLGEWLQASVRSVQVSRRSVVLASIINWKWYAGNQFLHGVGGETLCCCTFWGVTGILEYIIFQVYFLERNNAQIWLNYFSLKISSKFLWTIKHLYATSSIMYESSEELQCNLKTLIGKLNKFCTLLYFDPNRRTWLIGCVCPLTLGTVLLQF